MDTATYWLIATIAGTALMWMPYILHIILTKGFIEAMSNPNPEEESSLAPWARRAKKAHYNAIENLAIFAPLIILATMMNVKNPQIVTAAMVYFFARMAHYIVYTLGIPFFRTILFLVGWGANVVIILALLKILNIQEKVFIKTKLHIGFLKEIDVEVLSFLFVFKRIIVIIFLCRKLL